MMSFILLNPQLIIYSAALGKAARPVLKRGLLRKGQVYSTIFALLVYFWSKYMPKASVHINTYFKYCAVIYH